MPGVPCTCRLGVAPATRCARPDQPGAPTGGLLVEMRKTMDLRTARAMGPWVDWMETIRSLDELGVLRG